LDTVNLLLINHYAGSPEMGMEYRPYYFAKEWQKKGHQVRIAASSFSHLRNTQPSAVDRYSSNLIDNIPYTWIKTLAYTGNSQKRVINMLSFVVGLYAFKKWLPENFKPDVVIASSTYPLDIYPACQIAKKFKAKLIYEVHDLWPLSPMELGGYSKYHPFIIMMQKAENYAYNKSNHVISMLPKALTHMVNHGLSVEKYSYIPNGIDTLSWITDPVAEVPYSSLIRELKKNNKFLVCYAGSLGIANALPTLIKAASLIKLDSIHLIIIGNGPEKPNLEKLKNEFKLQNLDILEGIPKKNIPSFLNSMDVLYIGLQRQSLFRFGISPNKIMDYMMAAKPIIQAIESGNDMTTDAGCGITVEPENPEAVADAVMKLYRMTPDERMRLGQNGKEYVLKNHDYRILAQQFLDVMQK